MVSRGSPPELGPNTASPNPTGAHTLRCRVRGDSRCRMEINILNVGQGCSTAEKCGIHSSLRILLITFFPCCFLLWSLEIINTTSKENPKKSVFRLWRVNLFLCWETISEFRESKNVWSLKSLQVWPLTLSVQEVTLVLMSMKRFSKPEKNRRLKRSTEKKHFHLHAVMIRLSSLKNVYLIDLLLMPQESSEYYVKDRSSSKTDE